MNSNTRSGISACFYLIKNMNNKQEIISNFKCPICGNTDIHSIGCLNGKPYCRRCISFKGEEVEYQPSYPKKAPIHLSYELSPEQKELSNKLVENYKKGIDSLVFAVCGSGKTEIVLQLISNAISNGQKVGFAVPRRDVVKELYQRFSSIFVKNHVIAVYGGHVGKLEGDLVCLTTHQIFRYKDYFDLLIVDEIDAFPFNGNDVLNAMFFNSIRGHYVMMSATPSQEIINEFKKKGKSILKLNKRYHGHPLPVPTIQIHFGIMKYFHLRRELQRFLSQNKPVFVFAPTIDKCEQVYNVLRLLIPSISYVHSKCEDRNQRIDDFRNGKIKCLVTTAVLERGVTVKNLQVVVFGADHKLYDSHALVQIAGRVGRKKDAPDGEVIFFASKKTKEMEKAIDEIKSANSSL